MFFDVNCPSVMQGVFVFPDFVFPDLPVQSNQIKETINITGSSSSNTAVTGILDQPEN